MPKHSDNDSDDSRGRRRHRYGRSRSHSSDKSSSSSSVRKSYKKSKSSRDSLSRSRSRSRERNKNSTRNRGDLHHSRSRNRRSRSTSTNRNKGRQRSRSRSKEKKIEKPSVAKSAEVDNANFLKASNLSPEEQLKLKMQLALKAAAEADAQLREKGILPPGSESREKAFLPKPETRVQTPLLTIQEQINRVQAIDSINAPEFQPQEFKSSRLTAKPSTTSYQPDDHSAVIFGSSLESKAIEERISTKPNVILDRLVKDQLVHENLFVDMAAKQERWVRKLYVMRQRRLNGEAMAF